MLVLQAVASPQTWATAQRCQPHCNKRISTEASGLLFGKGRCAGQLLGENSPVKAEGGTHCACGGNLDVKDWQENNTLCGLSKFSWCFPEKDLSGKATVCRGGASVTLGAPDCRELPSGFGAGVLSVLTPAFWAQWCVPDPWEVGRATWTSRLASWVSVPLSLFLPVSSPWGTPSFLPAFCVQQKTWET